MEVLHCPTGKAALAMTVSVPTSSQAWNEESPMGFCLNCAAPENEDAEYRPEFTQDICATFGK